MVPTRPVAAHSHSSRKMISPAYMLPNSRSECDSGLEMYSTRLNRKLAGHSSGFEPNGAQNSSWIQPPRPFDLDREEDHQQPHRQRQREGRVDVGRRHDAQVVLLETCA